MHVRLKINDTIIKNLYFFLFLNISEKREIIIKKNKSIRSGEMLRPLDTVIILKIKPFIRFEIIKKNSNK